MRFVLDTNLLVSGVIAAAVTGQADLIASGDKRDLLPLGGFAGIPIVTAGEAVERLEARRVG